MPNKPTQTAPVVDEEILDFSDVKPFEPLDSKEIYLIQVDDIKKVDASGDKGAYFATEFSIKAPEEVCVEIWEENEAGELVFKGLSDRKVKAAGRKLFRNFSLSPQSLPFLYQFIQACKPDEKPGEAYRFNPAAFIGCELATKGDNSAYNEQVRLQPNRLYPASKYKG